MDSAFWTAFVVAIAAVALGVYLRSRRIETVYPWESALLYVNGSFARQLPADPAGTAIGPS